MNILNFPEELILYIFVPLNIDMIFDDNSWLFTCKKFYNLQDKLIDKGCIKNDSAVCKIISIILKLRFNKIDYINMKTYREFLSQYERTRPLTGGDVHFNVKVLQTYVNSLIKSLAKYVSYKLGTNKIEVIGNILLWIISYNEMLEIKVKQRILESKINMLKSSIVTNINKSDFIADIDKESHFDIVHKDFSSYNVPEKTEIMCIKNGKFIISVTNMFHSIIGNNSRIRLTNIKTKDYNEFVEQDEEGNYYSRDDDDFYDTYDYYCDIGYYDEVTRFYIDKYKTKFKKINHFY